MLILPPTVRVFVAVDPVDMRGSFDALAGSVRRLGLDPVDGHLYVFFSRRRHMAKVLFFDRSGWCIFQKRLERGTFQVVDAADGAGRACVDGSALASLLEGIDLRAPRRRWHRQAQAAAM